MLELLYLRELSQVAGNGISSATDLEIHVTRGGVQSTNWFPVSQYHIFTLCDNTIIGIPQVAEGGRFSMDGVLLVVDGSR